MTTAIYQIRASYAFVERNINLIKRYWSWEIVWLVYSVADSLAVSFIGLGMGVITGAQNANLDTHYLVLYLLIGTLVWRFLSSIFYWMTNLINIERWEGTIEYTLMAPIHRLTHMAGQTLFAVGYSLFFTGVILVITSLIFHIDLAQANLWGGVLILIAGSLSFVGIGVMASILPLLFPERGEQMTHVFIALLLLISGVYYPVEVLPAFLQKLSVFSPAMYVLAGERKALLEGLPTAQLWPYVCGSGAGDHYGPGRDVDLRSGRDIRKEDWQAASQWIEKPIWNYWRNGDLSYEYHNTNLCCDLERGRTGPSQPGRKKPGE